MKNTTCNTFVNILNAIHLKGITTKDALIADQSLYNEFGLALQDFVHFALLSKSSTKSPDGKGNASKIDDLIRLDMTTREDVEFDCITRIIEKLDDVLCQPIEKQKNYCYSICNHRVCDHFREIMPRTKRFKIVSLNSLVEGVNVTGKGTYTYEDVIADNTYNPERLHVERESIKELKKKLKVKQDREMVEKKETILREVFLLSKRPAEVMARLACVHLNMKPRRLASLIVDRGCENTYAKIIFEVAKRNNIELSDIRNIVADHYMTPESFKAGTNSADQVAGQISRLVYRANKRLVNN